MGWRQPRIGRTTGPLGLDVGHHSIKLSQIELGPGGPRLAALASRATPPGVFDGDGYLVDPDSLAGALRDMANELGVAGADVVAALSTPSAHVALLDVLAEPDGDLAPAACQQLAPLLDYPLDEASVVLRLMRTPPYNAVEPYAPAYVKVLACAMPAALVVALEQAIESAGLAPLVIEAAPLPAGHLLLGDGAGPASVLVGDLGATQTTWTLWQDLLPVFVTTLPLGGQDLTEAAAGVLGGDPEAAEAWKLSDPWDESLPAAAAVADQYLKSLLQAISALAQPAADGAHESAPRWPMSLIVLHGAGALLRDLAPRLAEATGLRVEWLDGFARLGMGIDGSLPNEVGRYLPQWANCLGLAWRQWVVEG